MGLFSCTHNFIQMMGEDGNPYLKKEKTTIFKPQVWMVWSIMICTKCGEEKEVRLENEPVKKKK